MSITRNKTKKVLGLLFSVLVVLGMIAIIATAPMPGENPSYDTAPARMMISGTYVCLPHTNTEGPQTMECAYGIKTDEGAYYAIDFSLLSQAPENIEIGNHVTASGVVIPRDQISSSQLEKYPIEGIFSVTDSLDVSKVK